MLWLARLVLAAAIVAVVWLIDAQHRPQVSLPLVEAASVAVPGPRQPLGPPMICIPIAPPGQRANPVEDV